MTVAATALSGVKPFGGRVAPRGASRRVARGVALGAGTLGIAVVLAATATMTAVWLVAAARPDNLSSHSVTARGPGAMALAQFSTPPGKSVHRLTAVQASGDPADAPTFEDKWSLAAIPESQPRAPALTVKSRASRTKVAALTPVSSLPALSKPLSEIAKTVPLPRARPSTHNIAHQTPAAAAPKITIPVSTAKPAPPAPPQKVVLAALAEKPAAAASPKVAVTAPTEKPASRPQKVAAAMPTEKSASAASLQKLASAPAEKLAAAPAQKLAMATPPDITGSIPREAPQQHREPPQPVLNKVSLPAPGSRVAVYDISARTVYLPSGEKLEAHSGLGEKMDDPRHVNVRMRGATPPNIYNLAMRESLFHGVAAIRLKPVHEDRMYGRDGILAHTYMLGSNGQSNGCVSFKNYAAFLRAFQKGEFDRLVVVAKLGDPMPDLNNLPEPVRTARATPVRRWRVADSQTVTPRQHALTGQW
jgi:type VI secretion system (T6SS) effector TldE1-like protein